jgi:hypothetical protein
MVMLAEDQNARAVTYIAMIANCQLTGMCKNKDFTADKCMMPDLNTAGFAVEIANASFRKNMRGGSQQRISTKHIPGSQTLSLLVKCINPARQAAPQAGSKPVERLEQIHDYQ